MCVQQPVRLTDEVVLTERAADQDRHNVQHAGAANISDLDRRVQEA
jgi:hypothetical protein